MIRIKTINVEGREIERTFESVSDILANWWDENEYPVYQRFCRINPGIGKFLLERRFSDQEDGGKGTVKNSGILGTKSQ